MKEARGPLRFAWALVSHCLVGTRRDHLIPISRGGTNEWTNVVTACSTCNARKGNHYAAEIGMHPLHAPVEPHFVHLSWAVRRLTPTQARYIRLFYGAEALHRVQAIEQRMT